MTIETPDQLAIETKTPGGDHGLRLKIDARALAKALAKGIVFLKYGDYPKALAEAIEAVAALLGRARGTRPPAEQAWLWLHRSAVAALAWTIRSSPTLTDRLGNDEVERDAFVRAVQAGGTVLITPEFLDSPQASPFFARITAGVAAWLTVINAKADERDMVTRRLGQEFAIALDLEMRSRHSDYEALATYFAPTPVSNAAERARRWRSYGAGLVAAIRKPLLNFNSGDQGSISLEEIFVPLRAWYSAGGDLDEGTERGRRKYPVFVDLAQHVDAWLSAAESNDAIRVVSGEPGCGKSSFAQMWAAARARDGRRVLYLPLHMLRFERDAFDAICAFAKAYKQLGCNPFEGLEAADPLILILDGVDELTQVSEDGAHLARTFVESLHQNLFENNFREQHARVLALLIGRPLAIADSTATLRKVGQRVEILRLLVRYEEFPDVNEWSLPKDLRHQWWSKYNMANGTNLWPLYNHGSRHLEEITAQPLLNYLLALVLEDRLKREEPLAIDSIHKLYREVFVLLYRRKQDALASRAALEDRFSFAEYQRLLEEVAIAAWHTGDRAVTREEIKARFEACDLGLRDRLQDVYRTLDAGLFAVLNAFFVAPESGGFGHYTFTHKSFREYLTAARIIREVERLHKRLTDPELGETHVGALQSWFRLTGSGSVDPDLRTFLRQEMAARQATHPVTEWRETLKNLFEATLRDGMPGYREAMTFREAERHAANAEAVLFVTLNACICETLKPSEKIMINWNKNDSVSRLLRRINDRGPMGAAVRQCLNNLDLSGADLSCAVLSSGNLIGADLANARLDYALLDDAVLSKASLQGASLVNANLEGANLMDTDLRGADLSGSRLRGVYVKGARRDKGTRLARASDIPAVWHHS